MNMVFGGAVKICTVTQGQTFGTDEVLLGQATHGLHVKHTNLQESDIIIVFCPISSRAGSDVQAAMRGVPGDKKVILVQMHHTRDVNYSTSGTKWFDSNVLEVHVLFHDSVRGLLTCEKNKEAVNQMQAALAQKSHGFSSWYHYMWIKFYQYKNGILIVAALCAAYAFYKSKWSQSPHSLSILNSPQ